MIHRRRKIFIAVTLFIIFGFNCAEAIENDIKKLQENKAHMQFTPDPKIQEIAEHYVLDAISFAQMHFNIELDWSDESIKEVESILDYMCKQALVDKPSEDVIFTFSKIFGSYIGEVYRRNHGAEWGMCWDGESFVGLQSQQKSMNFWPWGRVQNRIKMVKKIMSGIISKSYSTIKSISGSC